MQVIETYEKNEKEKEEAFEDFMKSVLEAF